ncbi:MAG: thiamine pyrophosphate-binding protein [Chloroflexota bacterium]|jgi:acetolactate synthase-1/2/3 large subunit|nr:thiamine pyrophosphate-binding protein [Chloroflexota bacterium]MDP6508673.1 thiamine pyrophosphate-binding protein [Chloroflexota bacterium]MDP6758674.1 thiamine pyrophosphate-binding protein [Chloroflexota bacterium]
MASESTVARETARFLASRGIERVYGLPGGEVTHLIEALEEEGIAFVLTHHETFAAHMADAEAQLAGRPAVCLCTVGPGATNIVNGIANSMLDRTPVLLLMGEFNDSDRAEWTHMNVDLLELFRPVSKLVERMYAGNCAELLERAWDTAIAPMMGPVCVALSSDDAQAGIAETNWAPEDEARTRPAEPAQGDVLRERLEQAERPALVAGIGVRNPAISQGLAELAEAWDVPIVITPKAKGWVSSEDPRLAGVYASYGSAKLQSLLKDADLVIGVGLDGTDFIRPWRYGEVLDLAEIAREDPAFPAERLVTDVAATLRDAAVDGTAKGSGVDRAAECRRAAWKDVEAKPESDLAPPAASKGGIQPYAAIESIRGTVGRETVVVCDVGMLKLALCQYWEVFSPNTFLVSNGLSTMGYGLPGAIGAAHHVGDEPVVALVGDGGLLMCLGDLDTLARTGRRVVVLVAVDTTLSLIRLKSEGDNLRGSPNDFGTPDFVAIATGVGMNAVRAVSESDLAAKVEECLALDGPSLIEFPLDYRGYRRMGG